MLNTDSFRVGGSKQLLSEEIYWHVGEAIVRGELEPRTRIRDVDLARQLHVSRMPVREALQRLERVGLIRMYPSRYTEVSEVTPDIVAASLEFAAFQAGYVARLAAARMDDEQRAEAVSRIDAVLANIDSPPQFAHRRSVLFGYLGERGQSFLQHSLMHESSLALMRNLQDVTFPPEDRDAVIALWHELRSALLTGDPDKAERTAREVHFRLG